MREPLTLNDGNIVGPAWATTGKTLAWDGTIGYRNSQQSGMVVDVDGTLRGTELDLNLPEIGLALQDPDLAVKGKTTLTIADAVENVWLRPIGLTRPT